MKRKTDAIHPLCSKIEAKKQRKKGNQLAPQVPEGWKTMASTPRFLLAVASLLEKSIQRNEKLFASSFASSQKDSITVFDGSKAPNMNVRQYMERIFKYASCSTSCFVVAYIYIERFVQGTGVRLTSLNIHRLLITSVLVAAKFMDYLCHNNAYYAKVGGVSTAEMNNLEMEFLFNLDFKLHVTTEVYGKYCQQLERVGRGL
ncbi:cyclin-P3-1 isoform X1 [Ziziphus jujuba]|uniref:Cyclin-P3-1 isoform X1 n=3 Tax=Ziziphus jujuba TaxID=326968 RepID=A0A6P3ZJF1_ZIZJJ|nr:cyclin-P3-1 isoform X1 [Ziziphus jujuba]